MKRKLFLSILILSVLFGLILITQTSNRAVAAGPLCYVDDTALGLNDGSSWENAFTDLQSALTDMGCTHIEVAQGTYAPTTAPDRTATFLLRSGLEIYGGYPDGGGMRDPSTYVTILSGFIVMGPGTAPPEPYYSYHVVSAIGVDSSAVLDGFTIQDGMAMGLGGMDIYGGGMLLNSSSPTLQNLVIRDNDARTSGGGMFIDDSSPTMTNVAFRNNATAETSSTGGGLSIQGVSSPQLTQVEFTGNISRYGGGVVCSGSPSAQLSDATFQGNSASWGGGLNIANCGMSLVDVTFEDNTVDESGGGMFTSGTGLYSTTLTRVTFTGNSAVEGGGMYSDSGAINLTDVTFTLNQAGYAGGGLYIDDIASATIRDSQFTSNNASGGTGGALYVVGSVNMVDSILDQNTASTGGGLALSSSTSPGTFTNLIVTGNTATDSGGGIYAYYGPAPIFTNLLLAGNSAWRGGGMANYNYMDPEIVNATIYGNRASDSGSAIYNYQSSPSLTNVIVWGNTETVPGTDIVNSGPASGPAIASSILEEGCPSGATCSGIITSDPLFVDAANDNLRLQAASPAIDAGNNAALPVEVTTDLDARPRFVDVPGVPDSGIGTPPIVDIGPYEAHYESNLIIYVDQDAPGPIQDGSSWATAYTGLQNGLAVAVEGDQIWVAEGVYYPGSPGAARTVTFQLKNGVALYGGFAGMEASLDERDWAAHPTTLSGDLDGNGVLDDSNAYHVVSGSGLDSSAVLDGLTIAAGNANGADPLNRGGGIYMPDSSPTLQNLVIGRNSAAGAGGGMYGYGAPYLANVTFLENHSNDEGGGLYILSGNATIQNALFHFNTAEGAGGGFRNHGNASLTNVTFSENEAGGGGGMFSSAGDAHLTNVTFSENQGNIDGGGLMLWDDASLTNVTFTSNSSLHDGGGMHISFDADAILNGVQFISNTATTGGGGLYIGETVSLTIYDSIFTSNTADVGGGLNLSTSDSIIMVDCLVDQNIAILAGGGLALWDTVSADFYNLTVTGNQAINHHGGGIHSNVSSPSFTNLILSGNSAPAAGGMANLGSSPKIVNATIYGNQASDSGSAIYNSDSSPVLTNSIVWGNTETVAGPDIVNAGISAPTITATLLEDGACPVNATCTGLVFGDPQFSHPANNDFSPLASSPAVDAGNVAALPADTFDLDGDADLAETIPYDLTGNRRIVLERVDLGAYEAQLWNINWTEAAPLPLVEGLPDVQSIEIDRYLDRMGQSRWFTFTVKPDSKVIVTLTGLSANYDLTLYKDIAQAYNELNSPQDLVQLSAEFAPDTFSPDTFSPDTFSPDTFSPDTFSPDTFSPDTFSPDTFSPDTFSPDTYSPDTFSPDTFSSAQTRSLIAVSAYEGTLGEGIMVNTWTRSGDFYVRVRGRNGAYDPDAPFHLQVIHLSGVCNPVSPLLPASNTQPPDGEYETLILTNMDKTEGTPDEIATLQTNLAALAAETNGWVVDVGADNRVSAAALQAESNPACVYAKNLEAYAVKEIVDGFRALNPLEYIVLVGNDQAIPFFRYRDNSLLASEMGYSPPVRDNTTSQASLKSGYILTQDTYAAGIELSTKAYELPLPDLAIGRLVETASDINQVLAAYLATGDGIVYPANALVTGYDFLEDVANAVRDELQAGLGGTVVDTLIMSSALSPEDPLAWTGTDLQNSLLGSDHDLVFLAGHFSASGALAADYKTHLWTSEVLASATDFTGDLIYSAGCHSGYNIVNAHDVPNGTIEPDWAQTFAAKGATFIGGTGYQYGDTEFIEYSERLYLEFTRQLRYGSGPVAVGKALAQAKQVYLANTPLMRGIHEKSLLEATLFGLPMMQVALPFQATAPVDETIVGSTDLFATDPGNQLGLEYADIHLTSVVTETTIPLDVLSQSGGDPTQVIASYLEGPDGVVVNAAEPVLPLDMLNVTHPISSSFVLRGIGWRGGDYTDLPDRLPLTGAATQDLRAPHPAFFSDIFYPVRAWNVNYFDALSGSGGPTRLAWMPAQYRSSSPGSMTGILRRFDAADFRLYYSGNISSYTTSEPTWTNTPALSAPPDISRIMSTINPDGTLSFEVTVVGDPAAGIQEVWIVYTGESGSLYGAWFPLDLVRDPVDTRLWRGTLSTADTPAADLRFVVQAVNGVGLVTMMTNEGAYYRAGVEPGAPPLGETPVTLELETPPDSGEFGGQASFTAVLTTLDGAGQSVPLAGAPVAFHLGGQGRMALTGSDGRATASFFLLALPDEYALTAAFYGNETYAPASDSSYFEVLPGTSALWLEPAALEVFFGTSTQFTATLTSGGLPLSLKPVALTLVEGGATAYTRVATTNYAGQARWDVPSQALGSYTVTAWFGLPVSAELDLSTPFYNGASSSASLVVYPLDFSQVFSGFLPPVDDPPVVNKVKAGSAVPVKFSLGGDFGLDIFADGYPTTVINACEGGITSVVEETVSAGESDLIYDPLTGEYTYVWKTDKKWANTCQTLVLQFVDGTQVFALFQFTK